MLTKARIDDFWRDGFLVVEDAVTHGQLAALKAEITQWVAESRRHDEPFGPPTIDGRPRFDMAAEHSAEHAALRRINNPSDISPAYLDVMRDAASVDMVADLIGHNVKFHHCKINLKLPGSGTAVAYHQDFLFTPHTNDDLITALLFLDDVSLNNGCLRVVPGSHKGPLFSLFEGGRFTGAVCAQVEARLKARSVPVTGKSRQRVCLCIPASHTARRPMLPRGRADCIFASIVLPMRFHWPATRCPARMKEPFCAARRFAQHG